MNETDPKERSSTGDAIEFTLDDGRTGSSSELTAKAADVPAPGPAEPKAADPDTELSPVLKLLAEPKLPVLSRENRARLQMQSPNRLYFYWSVRSKPFQTLSRAFAAGTGSYTLVVRLIDLDRDIEEMHAVEPQGSRWFDVHADREYRAEVGFYAPNRPFVRVLFSNTVRTPRKSPSPLVATDADWRIPAQKFAQVLDVAGFKRDAFDVAVAGDNLERTADATHRAFSRLAGGSVKAFDDYDSEELRYVLFALAAGATLEDLRFRVGARLFALLQNVTGSVEKGTALAALKSEFDIDEGDLLGEEEVYGPSVFGASLVNFPKGVRRLRTRPGVSRYEPVSSRSK
jgi:hypothetical protein